MKKTAKNLVDEAMVQVTTYTVEQARALHGHPGVQFVDLRDVRELEREGVIPGAVHAPRGMLEFWVDPLDVFPLQVRLDKRNAQRIHNCKDTVTFSESCLLRVLRFLLL